MTEDDDGKRRWDGKGIREGSSGRSLGKRKIRAHNVDRESSRRWIERQLSDPYVRAAKSAGYRSRAAFKLIEIDEKTHILRPGLRVVDLGAAPGGWVQVALERGVTSVVGIDLLPMELIAGAHLVQGDIADDSAVAQMMEGLGGPPDLVLSDMAANTTGHRQTDHLRTVALVELAVDFAIENLAPGGAFCAKVFQGGAAKDMLDRLRQNFTSIKHIKPPSSRTHSPEVFVVAKGFGGRVAIAPDQDDEA